MEIRCEGLSKRFGTSWVFNDLTFSISPGSRIAVKGPNGSGKSTLLKILLGALPPSKGKVRYAVNGQDIPLDSVFNTMAFAAPYASLVEDLTLRESWKFHGKFREWLEPALTLDDFHKLLGYPFDLDAQIMTMSSGMKQRLRLAFAIFTGSAVLMLDEPTTNLDESGVAWFHDLMREYLGERTTVIASNVTSDVQICTEVIDMGLV